MSKLYYKTRLRGVTKASREIRGRNQRERAFRKRLIECADDVSVALVDAKRELTKLLKPWAIAHVKLVRLRGRAPAALDAEMMEVPEPSLRDELDRAIEAELEQMKELVSDWRGADE